MKSRRASLLTVDLGNTRLKALAWDAAGRDEPLERYEGRPDDDAFASWLERAGAGPAALSSVASAESTRAVLRTLERRGAAVLTGPPAAVENRCREPERVGQDRLFAALGAAERLRAACLVVDAGTALTVDAVVPEGAGAVFLGGAIAPGPELGAAALAGGTANLPHVRPEPCARALGRVTEEAILSGLVVGFRGAADRLVEEIAREAALGPAGVVLTGGGRRFLLEPGPFTARRLDVVPELVHRGLLAALRARLEGADPA